MNRCDVCKQIDKDFCVCVPYGCECFELDLEEHDKQIKVDAIDTYFDNIKKYCRTSSCIGCRFCNDETCEIAVIKEQLKEQKNDNDKRKIN